MFGIITMPYVALLSYNPDFATASNLDKTIAIPQRQHSLFISRLKQVNCCVSYGELGINVIYMERRGTTTER